MDFDTDQITIQQAYDKIRYQYRKRINDLKEDIQHSRKINSNVTISK